MKGGKRWVLYASLAGLVGLVVLLAWASQDRLSPVEIGGPAPDISTSDLHGVPRTLDDFRGKVLLINIWATWCTPCKAEMPSLQRLYEQIRDDDFQILAVSIDRAPPDDDPAKPLGGRLQAFADSLGLSFPILHDPAGDITLAYQTTGVPESFILDRRGYIHERVLGPREWDDPRNVEMIRGLLHAGEEGGQ